MKKVNSIKELKKLKRVAVYENGVKPVVGMGATCGFGSDCYPYTITAVNKTGKTIKMVQTNPIWEKGKIVGYDESYTPDMGAVYTLRKNGRFTCQGSKSSRGGYVSIGGRSFYQDPSF